jgi:hypothetical protein
MGYHVSIIRTTSGSGNPITIQEIIDLADKSPGFRVENQSSPSGSCALLVYSRHGLDVCGLQLDERAGVLWTKDPEGDALEVMLNVAAALGGRVRGDGNETYRTASDTYFHPDDQADREAAKAEDARSLRTWRGRRAVWRWVQMFAALTLVIGLVMTFFRR